MPPPDKAVRFESASDQSLLIYLGDTIDIHTNLRVRKLLRLLETEPIAGIGDLQPAYCSVLVKFDPLALDHATLEAELRPYLARLDEVRLSEARLVEIPVCYEGEFAPDLEEVAALHHLTPAQVIDLHSSATYTVYFLGFVPGFAYLGGLPEELATPRLATPRKVVPAGSLGIGGSQTGIYPLPTPGGWRLIGRTPLLLFHPRREPINLLQIGDRVRFLPTPLQRLATGRSGKLTGKAFGPVAGWVDVDSPGLSTTVQDLGREGFGPLGVSASGAADRAALRLGNRLVGNAETAAGLEMTLVGGTFRFRVAATVALAGSDFGATLDGTPVELWLSVEVRAGQTLQLGATRSGARSYLCIQGGIQVPEYLGSAATLAIAHLGGYFGRVLQKGDVLEVGAGGEPFRARSIPPAAREHLLPRKILRVTPGPQSDWFSPSARERFYGSSYRVSEESNRQGLRLEGEPIAAPASEMITEGVSIGAVQVPPDGQPIIVFVDQQTTGGYPKIANVISADLDSVGQLRPRDEIRFELVDLAAARAALRAREELLAKKSLITP